LSSPPRVMRKILCRDVLYHIPNTLKVVLDCKLPRAPHLARATSSTTAGYAPRRCAALIHVATTLSRARRGYTGTESVSDQASFILPAASVTSTVVFRTDAREDLSYRPQPWRGSYLEIHRTPAWRLVACNRCCSIATSAGELRATRGRARKSIGRRSSAGHHCNPEATDSFVVRPLKYIWPN
jgi:hypothetical protein